MSETSGAPGAPPPRSRWPWRFAVGLFLVFNCAFCILCGGGIPPFKLYGAIFFGWATFLGETAPRIHVNPVAVGTFVGTLLLVTLGVHLLASWLRRSMSPDAPPWRGSSTVALVALFVLAFVAGIAAVGVFHQSAWLATQPQPFMEASGGGIKYGNEASAIGALKTIFTSQSIFREGDKEKDNLLDYGTLDELAVAELVDPILGAGAKQGYVFEAAPSVVSPEERWFATAWPARPDKGSRAFFVNQGGVVFYTTDTTPFRVDRATCEVPPQFVPTGK